MVESGYGRKIDIVEENFQQPTYNNETLFDDLPEYTEEMREETFMETDIYGNEINFWSENGEKSNAELAFELLEEEDTQPLVADGGRKEAHGEGFDAYGDCLPAAEPGSLDKEIYRSKPQDFTDQMSMNQTLEQSYQKDIEAENRSIEYDRMTA